MDFIKGLAIILVIWGHCLQYLSPVKSTELFAHRIIYSFHMPLFMMVSGYFAARLDKLENTWDFLKNKFLQLIVPVISGCIMVMIVSLLISKFFIGFGVFYTHYWFLKSLFLCFVIECLAYKIAKSLKHSIIVFTLSGLIISQLIDVWNVNVMYPAFMTGILMSRYNKFIQPYYWLIAVLCAVSFIMLYSLGNASSPIIIKLIMGICGGGAIIAGCKATFEIRPSIFNNFISKIGQYTLGIYILQTIILEMILAHYVHFEHIPIMLFSLVIVPVISIAITAICYLMIRVIEKYKLAARLILGRR